MPNYYINGSDSVTLLVKKKIKSSGTIIVKNMQSAWRVEAELCGSGSLPWAWAIYTSNPWLATDRSEAMFPTSDAAKRVGVMIALHSDLELKPRRVGLN